MPSSEKILLKLIQQETGEEFLLNKRETLIGRIPRESEGEEEGPDVPVSDSIVSRKHAIITVDNQECYIRNFGRNGTFVNGKDVDISYVNSGDEIRIGSTVFRLIIEGERETSQQLALIVDNDTDHVRRLEKVLNEEKYESITVGSGTEAIKELLNRQFSLVITEVAIPELDGFELCRYIRRHPDISKLTIIILTYLTNAPEVGHGYQQGADFYLAKPLKPDAIKECLKKVQGRHAE